MDKIDPISSNTFSQEVYLSLNLLGDFVLCCQLRYLEMIYPNNLKASTADTGLEKMVRGAVWGSVS